MSPEQSIRELSNPYGLICDSVRSMIGCADVAWKRFAGIRLGGPVRAVVQIGERTAGDYPVLSYTFAVPARALMQAIREQELEGILAKRASSAYRSGRSGDWLK